MDRRTILIESQLPLHRFLPSSIQLNWLSFILYHTTTTTVLRPFLRDHPGESVPEENFWALWYKGRLTEADIDHPAGCHSIQTNQCSPPPSPVFFTGQMPLVLPNQQRQSTEGNIIL